MPLVLPPILTEEPQTGSGKAGLTEGIVAAEHLVAAVHGVQRLLPPRAVLVVLVHTKPQGSHGGIVDLLPAGGTGVKGQLCHGVHGGMQPCMMQHNGLLRQNLQIPAAQPSEWLHMDIFSGLCAVFHAEIPLSDEPRHCTVHQMLAVGDHNSLGSFAVQSQRENACFLSAQIQQEPGAAVAADDGAGAKRLQRQVVNRTGMQLRVIAGGHGGVPWRFGGSGVVKHTVALLLGDELFPVRHISGAFAALGVQTGEGQHRIACGYFEEYTGLTGAVGAGGCAMIPDMEKHFVFSLAAEGCQIVGVGNLAVRKIGVLPEGSQCSVDIQRVVCVGGDSKHYRIFGTFQRKVYGKIREFVVFRVDIFPDPNSLLFHGKNPFTVKLSIEVFRKSFYNDDILS